MSLMVGDTFAGFRIVGLLGTGRMGRLYRVDRVGSAEHDALRVLPADLTADQRYRVSFIAEADIAVTLSHPHMVGIHDRGECDDQFWVSMDFVDGTDAAELIRDRYPTGMPVGEVADVISGVASALDHAHRHGLLHREVKPANVLIPGAPGLALLAGVGIARPVDESIGLTATDTELDTVAFTAPEQLIDEATDERSDQYALACTAFHLLTGSLPYPSFNAATIINKHVMAPPPSIGERRAEFAHLDPVFATALAKDPNDRYASCQDFADELGRGLLGSASDRSARIEPVNGAAPTRNPRTPPLRRQPLSEPPKWTGSPWWRRQMRRFSGKRWSNRKIMIAALASLGILAMVATTLAAVVMPLLVDSGQTAAPSTAAAPTSTTPAIVIKPLALRPVVDVPLVARPEDCPPVTRPVPPQEPIRACDVAKEAVYQLGPVGLELNLTGATAAKVPMSEFSIVQMSMDPASSAAFKEATALNIGKQIAFVRDGVVLAAPLINQPIDGQSIQISGELAGPAAETIARMLRDGS